MAVDRSQWIPADRVKQFGAISNRLREAREGIGATQTEFAEQISISRDRLASYEDGRAVLRCDVALRACRQFFVSEFWLALGSVNEKEFKAGHRMPFKGTLDARLTMALAVHPAAFACPPGYSFADGFDPFLRHVYCQLADKCKGFPKIAPLPSDQPAYFTNALNCMVTFWGDGLTPDQWRWLFARLVGGGHSAYSQIIAGSGGLISELPNAFYDATAQRTTGEQSQKQKK